MARFYFGGSVRYDLAFFLSTGTKCRNLRPYTVMNIGLFSGTLELHQYLKMKLRFFV